MYNVDPKIYKYIPCTCNIGKYVQRDPEIYKHVPCTYNIGKYVQCRP